MRSALGPAGGRRWFGWQVVVAAVVGAAVSPATLVNIPFSLFIPALQSEFGWTRPEITAALSIFPGLLVISLPLAGRLVDHFGARRVAIPSILAYGLALMSLYWLTPSLTRLYLLYGVVAVVGAGAQSLTFIRVLSAWFDRRRGLAIGACMAGYGIGYVLVPLITQRLISGYGWRLAYVGLGALAVLGALPVVALLLRDTPEDLGLAVDDGAGDGAGRPAPLTGKTLAETLRTREMWLLAASFVLMSAVLNGVQSQIVPLLTDRGMTVATAALMLSAVGIGSFPGRLIVGFMIDRIFAPFVAIGFYGLSAVALFWLVDGQSGTGILLSVIAVGLSLGAENDLLGYLTGRYFGLRQFGQIYGALLGAYLAGAALGPYLMARVYAATGSYRNGLRAGVVAIAGSCVLLLCLRRYSMGGRSDAEPDQAAV